MLPEISPQTCSLFKSTGANLEIFDVCFVSSSKCASGAIEWYLGFISIVTKILGNPEIKKKTMETSLNCSNYTYLRVAIMII